MNDEIEKALQELKDMDLHRTRLALINACALLDQISLALGLAAPDPDALLAEIARLKAK